MERFERSCIAGNAVGDPMWLETTLGRNRGSHMTGNGCGFAILFVICGSSYIVTLAEAWYEHIIV
jgi:hypothetical protein